MPPVRTLVTPAKGDTQPTTAALAVPEWASAAPAIPDQPLKGPSSAYVSQLQENTGKRQQLQAAGCTVGDFYIDDGGAVTPLKPLRFWLLQATPFRSKMSITGDIETASRDFHDKSKGDEHIVTLIVVDVNGKLVPAKADFRKAAWQLGNDAIKGVTRAASPDFPGESDAAKVASQFPAPFGRVVTTASVGRKIGRASMKPYFPATGVSMPTPIGDLQRLADAMKDDDFKKKVAAASEAYLYRLKQLDAKVK